MWSVEEDGLERYTCDECGHSDVFFMKNLDGKQREIESYKRSMWRKYASNECLCPTCAKKEDEENN